MITKQMLHLTNITNSKLDFLLKEELSLIAIHYKLIDTKDKFIKDYLLKLIRKDFNYSMAIQILDNFDRYGKIGLTLGEVSEMLNLEKNVIKKLEKNNKLNVISHYEVRAYGKSLKCPIYDLEQVVSFTEEGLEELLLVEKPLTTRQIAGIEKAKATKLKKRTCSICSCVESKSSYLEEGLCRMCSQEKLTEQRKIEILKKRKLLMQLPLETIIIDVETTGLRSYDQIVEIAIVNLHGDVLYNSLIKPTVKIPLESTDIHGITDEMVKDSPTFKEVVPALKSILIEKTIMGFNVEFDLNAINNTIDNYEGLEKFEFKNTIIDLMQEEMYIMDSSRYISLINTYSNYYNTNTWQTHRALDDCILCLDIIKKSIL